MKINRLIILSTITFILTAQIATANQYDALPLDALKQRFEKLDFNGRMQALSSPDGKASRKLAQVAYGPDAWKNYKVIRVYEVDLYNKDKTKIFGVPRVEVIGLRPLKQIITDPRSEVGKTWASVQARARIASENILDMHASLKDRSPTNPKPYKKWHYSSYVKLYNLLKDNRTFSTLDLTNANIGEHSLEGRAPKETYETDAEDIEGPLFQIINDYKNFRTLILKNISFLPMTGDRGNMKRFSEILAKILGQSKSLINIDLSDNNLGSDGAKTITSKLGTKTSIRTINLSGNNISKKVQDTIAQQHPTIKFSF